MHINYREVTEFGLPGKLLGKKFMTCYAFFVDGLLIDCCHPRGKKDFQAWLEELNVEQAVITHHHEDHAGNAALLNSRGVIPCVHSGAIPFLAAPPRLPLVERMIWGQPAPAVSRAVSRRIKTARHDFLVIDTPGHTEDHIVLWEEKEGWLFSGDLFLAEKLVYLAKGENVEQLVNSLKKVLKYDFAVVFCAHRGRVDSGKEALARKLDYLLELKERVTAMRGAGHTEAGIARLLLGREDAVTWFSLGDYSKTRLVHEMLKAKI